MQVHCISVSEHIWVRGSGPRDVGELPAGGIRASQGTFSSFLMFSTSMMQCHQFILPHHKKNLRLLSIIRYVKRRPASWLKMPVFKGHTS